MARRKQSASPSSPDIFTRFVLLIIFSFIAVGNTLRFLIWMLYRIPATLLRTSVMLSTELSRGIIDWLSEKPPAPPISRKRSTIKKNRHTRFFAGFRNFVGRIRLPPMHLPHIPTVHLPHLPVPRLPTVRFRMPVLRMQRPSPLPSVSPDKPSKRIHIPSLSMGILITVAFIFLPYNAWLFLTSLPNPQLLTQRDLEVSTKIMDRNGQLLYEIYMDQNRTPVKLEDIPLIVRQATIAIEDRNFYYHPGFSVRGILRAASEILIHKQIQGGSTITQQLIKSALLTPEVSVIRKAKEILLAFWAERLFSKDQIFEMYLNQVPYGGTAWGIESASQTYFRKSVTRLSLAEAALLAGLPAAPSEYSPFGSHPEKALVRQREVLERMVTDGYITPEQKDQAIDTPLQFAQPRIGIRAPHFVMYVKDLLEKRYGPRMLERGGLRVTTSLDLNIQEKAEDIVRKHIESLAPLQVGNGAAVVTNPRTGDILAMVGSRDYFDVVHDGNVNVTTAPQQPGSAIKVVTYAAALENGMTAATVLQDTPVVYRTNGSETYAPVNYDNTFHGPTPLRYALANSYNIPAVKTLAAIGLPTIMEKARQMGIHSWGNDPSRYGLSLTLGGGDVTMLELASVYGTLANMGKRQDLRPILQVTDYTGKILEDQTAKTPVDALKPEVAWILSNILADNAARTPAFGPNSALVIPGKTVSVKTGTTNDKRDNWTAGYTPSYAAVVWVGNNDNSPMNPVLTSGITGASPIWHDIMVELLKDTPDEIPAKPSSVVSLPCYFGKVEYFISGTEPPGGRCAPIPTITPTPNP